MKQLKKKHCQLWKLGQNLLSLRTSSSDKRFPNDLVCFAAFLSVKLTCDDSVIQLPKKFTSNASQHIFKLIGLIIKSSGSFGTTSELTIM